MIARLWHRIWHNRRSVLRSELAVTKELLGAYVLDYGQSLAEVKRLEEIVAGLTEAKAILRNEVERLRMRLSGYEKYPGKTDATHCNTLAEEAAVKRAAGALS
jgi:hypothetical protein